MSYLHKSIASADETEPRMLYSYHTAISGFAAKLSPDELKYMKTMDGFIHAIPDKHIPLLTSHTPDFLGLRQSTGAWNASTSGEGTIIGVLDTGVYPHHPSFNDDGMKPPSNWEGACQFKDFKCNNKIIGARAFGSTAVQDDIGHGTHTASTAAGNFVNNANVAGNAQGLASGIAPRAHLAIYQVCDEYGCSTSDILAGMDAAIKDGVDIMSLSLGGPSIEFFDDPIAQGAFQAMTKGIFVSCAAGNSGPYSASLSNEAPWLLTVAASTTDRRVTSSVKLGDGSEFSGESLFQPKSFSPTLHELVVPSKDPYCAGDLHVKVKNKIVVCKDGGDSSISKGEVVRDAGGAGMIIINEETKGSTTFAELHVLPASHVGYQDGKKILGYIKKTKKVTATFIFHGTNYGASPSPAMAYFSSRGPSNPSPGILKPDITGPGVNILAAWPDNVGTSSLSRVRSDNSSFVFNMISGTSMSTPHLSGIAALIKSEHKNWSPAMIKSAMMTTSDELDRSGKNIVDEKQKKATFFAMGAGHVNPSKAFDPGLIYDIVADEYIAYLCGLGYTDPQVGTIAGKKINCSVIEKIAEKDLNYPSISVTLGSKPVTVTRTVINVGDAESVYTLKVDNLVGVSIQVKPTMLEFSEVNEKKSFTVSFTNGVGKSGSVWESNLRWISDKHVVRSPISITI
ncbi:hypothetical protein J5N97_023984 [Dioscorea zingiberensis]|uniref:Uncharacterized protein n=1 Tax=Dioscorea zingiberensis TaxID=325984 RepID=A0A9D5H8H8_9LILI|nr:hypothetical protein J5N97_023984 [Dioscorea zingiberensis]